MCARCVFYSYCFILLSFLVYVVEVVLKAWNGLIKVAVQESGRLGYCQPVGGGPKPSNVTLTSDFCVGLFLLAAEQVAKMALL